MQKWIQRALPMGVGLAAFAGTLWGIGWLQGSAEARSPGAFPSSVPARETGARPAPSRPPAVGAGPEISAEDFQRAAALAADNAEESVRQALVAPVEDSHEPLEVRLDLYRAALEEAAFSREELLAYRSTWTEHFLRLDSVQEEIAALPPSARASALATVRRRMGYAEEEIERLAARDLRKDASWEIGLRYLEERRHLQETFEGDPLEIELAALRERHFGAAAETIAREEASGFERFQRPRVYGRN